MSIKALAREVRDYTLEALEWLVEVLQPWNVEEFCLRCGVPPLQIGTDWSSGLQSLREDAERVDAAEFASKLAAVIDSLVEAINAAQDSDSDWLALDIARPLITNVLLGVLQKRYEDSVRVPLLVTSWDAPYAKILHTLFIVVLLIDERLKESVRHTTIARRWAVLFDADALEGLEEPETQAGILTALGVGGIDLLFRALHKRFVGSSVLWKPMIQLGFDTHTVALSEEVAAAQRTVALLYGKNHRPLGQADYLRFDDPEPHIIGSRGSVIVVPVTRKPSEALDGLPGPAHGGAPPRRVPTLGPARFRRAGRPTRRALTNGATSAVACAVVIAFASMPWRATGPACQDADAGGGSPRSSSSWTSSATHPRTRSRGTFTSSRSAAWRRPRLVAGLVDGVEHVGGAEVELRLGPPSHLRR